MKDFIRKKLHENWGWDEKTNGGSPLTKEIDTIENSGYDIYQIQQALSDLENKYVDKYAEYVGDTYGVIDAIKQVLPRTLRRIYDDMHPTVANEQKLSETDESNNYVAYHGTPTKITKFSDSFVGGKDAMDQHGPGIYFTTSYDEALVYAGDNGFVYKVNLTPKNFVSDERNKNLNYLINPITKLIKLSPNWKRVARGYSDDVEEGLEDMLHKYIGMSSSEKEAFISVFMDIYKNDPVNYVKNMGKLGYDGIYLKRKDSGAHIVVYKPSIIKIIEAENV